MARSRASPNPLYHFPYHSCGTPSAASGGSATVPRFPHRPKGDRLLRTPRFGWRVRGAVVGCGPLLPAPGLSAREGRKRTRGLPGKGGGGGTTASFPSAGRSKPENQLIVFVPGLPAGSHYLRKEAYKEEPRGRMAPGSPLTESTNQGDPAGTERASRSRCTCRTESRGKPFRPQSCWRCRTGWSGSPRLQSTHDPSGCSG